MKPVARYCSFCGELLQDPKDHTCPPKKEPIQAKMMKTMDTSKKEVILYVLFNEPDWTIEHLFKLLAALLQERVGWSSPENFSRLLEDAQVKLTHAAPKDVQ